MLALGRDRRRSPRLLAQRADRPRLDRAPAGRLPLLTAGRVRPVHRSSDGPVDPPHHHRPPRGPRHDHHRPDPRQRGARALIAAGDADLLAERYDEALANYRAASRGRLRRRGARPQAAARRGGGGERRQPRRAADPGLPRTGCPRWPRATCWCRRPTCRRPAPARGPGATRATRCGSRSGRVVGAGGSAVFHRLTALAGRRGASGETWTNWYSVGERLPGPLRKWYQILKLAHMRETLFENNLVRPYPRGREDRLRRRATPSRPSGRGAGAAPTARGTTCCKDADGRYDPMVGAAYTRFFRNVGDDRGLAGIEPPENPATDPVSVRELSRRLLASKRRAPYHPVPQPLGGRLDPVPERRLGEPRLQRLEPDAPGSRSPRTTRCARYGIDHLTIHPTDPDPTRRPEDDGPAADLPERGDALVGRLPALRQRLGDPATGALDARAAGCTISDDGTLPVDPETGHRAHRLLAQLVGRAGAAAHRLRARAQRHLRHAGRAATRPGTTRRCSRPPGWSTPRVMAKIHTIEWTPAILPNHSLNDGMMSNWYGLVTNAFGGKHKHVLEDIPITSRELGGIVGNPQGTFAEVRAERGVHRRLPAALPAARRRPPGRPGRDAHGRRAAGPDPPRRVAPADRRARHRVARPDLRRAAARRAGQQQLPGVDAGRLGARASA